MIHSYANLTGCTISNSGNPLDISQNIINNVESGMINMNHKSIVQIKSSIIKNMVGNVAGMIFSQEYSSIAIEEDTKIMNVTG